MFCSGHGSPTPIGDMFPGAGNELASVNFSELKNFSDFPIWIVKCFMETELLLKPNGIGPLVSSHTDKDRTRLAKHEWNPDVRR